MAGRFSIEAVFKAVDQVTGPVRRISRNVARMSRGMSRGFERLNTQVSRFTAGLRKAGVVGVLAFGLITAAMADTISTGAGFEQAITDVGAVALQTRKQIAPLEQLALELGRTTKFTATQAAQAMEIMAKAGFKAQDILQGTPAILSAAAASGLEIAEVANVVSNVLKGMALDTSEAARVADVLALASARTNSTIGSLGESMKNVSSTARQLNIPLESVVASIALLQDVGLDASVAGSAMNNMLTKMASPSTEIARVMRRVGLSFKDAKGDMKPLPVVLKDLNAAAKKMGGNFDQVAFFAKLVGLRGQKAAANLSLLFETGRGSTLTAELLAAKGVADKMAALRMSTFEGSMLLLNSAVDAVKVRLFGLNSGPLTNTVRLMTAWVGANEDLIATSISSVIAETVGNLDLIITRLRQAAGIIVLWVALSTAVTALTGVLALLNIGIIGITATIAVLKGGLFLATAAATLAAPAFLWLGQTIALAFLLNPVGLFIAAIATVIALGAAVFVAWNPVKEFFIDLWASITAGVTDAVAKISELAGKFSSVFGFDGAGTTLPDSVQSIVNSFINPDSEGPPPASIVSPAERTARSIDEQRTTSTTEVTLTAGPGTAAEVTRGKLGGGLKLQQSGAF